MYSLFLLDGFHHLQFKSIRRSLADRYPKLKDVILDEDNITLALNEAYVTSTTPLKQGDVVALIPPISGG
jgi:molybdopterin converting factor small subunit